MRPILAALALTLWLAACVGVSDVVSPDKASRWKWAPPTCPCKI